MHHCLFVTEILINIFSLTTPDIVDGIDGLLRTPGKHSRKSLAALARTCKAFQDPALEILWTELDCLAPLIQCLPRDLWAQNDMAARITLRRPFCAEDWLIFQKYALRVRSIARGFWDRFDIKLIEALGSAPPHMRPLLPNLQAIRWNGHCALEDRAHDTVELLAIFAGPKVVELAATFGHLNGIHITTLISLGTLCPNLKRFQYRSMAVESRNEESATTDIITYLITQWQHLEIVQCSREYLGDQAILYLAQLPSLKQLVLDQISSVTSLVPRPAGQVLQPVARRFNALKGLRLQLQELPHGVTFIHMLQSPIEKIFISYRNVADVMTMTGLFIAMSHHITHEQLDTVFIGQIQDFSTHTFLGDEIYDYTVNIDVLRPLFCFRGLKSLILGNYFNTFDLDDKTLEAMALSWPLLEFLRLGEYVGWGLPSRITLGGFATLIKHCPKLIELTLVLDATSVPEVEEGVCNRNITSLVLLNSTLHDGAVDAVAEFLWITLPNVNKILTCGSPLDRGDYRVHWGVVTSLINSFREDGDGQ